MEVVFSDSFMEQLIGMKDKDKEVIEEFVNLLKACRNEKELQKTLKSLKLPSLD